MTLKTDPHAVNDEAALGEFYGTPSPNVVSKSLAQLDRQCAEFISRSPLLRNRGPGG